MAGQISGLLVHAGIILCRAVFAREHVIKWKCASDARYEDLEIARRNGDTPNLTRITGTRERFVPTASSFTIGALSSESNISQLLNAVSTGAPGMWIKNILG